RDARRRSGAGACRACHDPAGSGGQRKHEIRGEASGCAVNTWLRMSVRIPETLKRASRERPRSGLGRAHAKAILLVASAASFAVLAASAIGVFIPTLPREVVMATGPSGGAYAQLGERYKPIFARQGIRLVVLNTAGSIENLAKL